MYLFISEKELNLFTVYYIVTGFNKDIVYQYILSWAKAIIFAF